MYIYVLFCVVLLNCQLFSNEDQSLGEIEDKLNIQSYNNLEFNIVSEISKGDARSIKTNETIRVHFPKSGPAWKYWIQKKQDEYDQEWIINRFEITNVVESRMFHYTNEAEGEWSKGTIIPDYVWDENQDCIFLNFLGMDTIGLSLFSFDVTHELHQKVAQSINYKYVKQDVLDGYNVNIYKGRDEVFGAEYELGVINEPQVMFVHYLSKGIRDKFEVEYKVESIKTFEDIIYPEKGVFRQKGNSNTPSVDYSFQVINVERFDKRILSNWFPEWPESTIIGDEKNGKSITIAPSTRQHKKIAQNWGKVFSKDNLSSSIFRIILAIISFTMIGYALYVKWKKSRKEGSTHE